MNPTLPTSAHHIRESAILLSIKVAAALVLGGIMYSLLMIVFFFGGIANDSPQLMLIILWILYTALFIIETYAVLFIVLQWARRAYYLSEHHLIRYQGIMQLDEHIYDLQNIRSVDVYENWLGRLLNFGDIHMTIAASGYHEEIWLRGIAEARKYERVFRGFLEPEPENVEQRHERDIEVLSPPSAAARK